MASDPDYVHTLGSGAQPTDDVTLPKAIADGIEREVSEMRAARDAAAVSGGGYIIV